MKPHPPPDVPGNTEAEKFDNALRTIFRVSKDAIVRAEEEYRRTKPPSKRLGKREADPA
jgi:hypothetical protein